MVSRWLENSEGIFGGKEKGERKLGFLSLKLSPVVKLCLSSPIIRGGNNLEFFGKLSRNFFFFFISLRRIIIGTFLEISKRSIGVIGALVWNFSKLSSDDRFLKFFYIEMKCLDCVFISIADRFGNVEFQTSFFYLYFIELLYFLESTWMVRSGYIILLICFDFIVYFFYLSLFFDRVPNLYQGSRISIRILL